MLQTVSFRIPALLFLCASALLASDVSGTWAGTVRTGTRTVPIRFELHQQGSQITGSMSAQRDAPVNGRIDGNVVSLHAQVGIEDLRFELSLAGNQMQGKGWSKKNQAGGEEGPVAINVSRETSITGLPAPRNSAGGTWVGTVQPEGTAKGEAFTLHLVQSGTAITGDLAAANGDTVPIFSGTIQGNKLSLVFHVDTNKQVNLAVTVDGGMLSGKAVATSSGEKRLATITAIRQPS
jgi:hypothetical protein